VIDTNILLDWLLERDVTRLKKINRLFASHKRFVVPDMVMTELIFALEKVYKLPRSVIMENLLTILAEPRFICHDSLIRKAATLYSVYQSLSFIDCYLLELGEIERTLPLWTSDKKLVTLGKGRARLLK
jgi:predicted nucleic-acid-binding protein